MLTQEGCHARQQRLWNAVPDDVEWLLIADPRHVLYLSNFLVHPLSFSGGERGLLLLEREGEVSLLADNFTIRSSTGTPFVDREVIENWYDHKNSVINRDHALLAAVKKVSEQLYGRKGAVEAEWLPLGAWDVLGLDHESHSVSREAGEVRKAERSIDLGTLLRELRRQKEPDEIALMKKCMTACNAGHARAMEIVKPGISELDIYREVQSAAIAAAGCPALVYGDFRATNAITPKAGGLPTNYVLQEGDLFILDYSVVINGYRSDFTNTIAVGKPTDEQEKLFQLCLSAMKGAESQLQAGASAQKVYQAASQPIEEAGYPPLGHHAGHGLGLGHPEPPILTPESRDTLLAGDVITIEPGLYIEGIGGIRIEHNYLITETGYEVLSNHNISLT
ncbi:Aminopeptidase YpdF (MP-, MA-, MS-, AP-, NP-specific) [hydrothermal vent metagenome]|uniref:Aminopeptidase YpdF (MP-, MA-, MS-, AP-, NP-specific) n=1 Tax=hydrothermal vent metagenome TaxID=652676 RepID=A0A3B1DKW4_9ZZZZ